MSTLQSLRLKAEAVRSISAGAIGAAYSGIGSQTAQPARQFFIQNLTDALLMFSFNGLDDHFPLPPNGFLLMDVTSNKSLSAGYFLAKGDRLYVKEIGTPTTGSVYFSVFYGAD